ncbi:MAG: Cof-type HAD-IIB family hydrolase [Bacillota bacterium]|jgi:Cof subfamily protein (haloacid dehalogenase superfamily)|nr:Cof-type HAD-IIB family hydrolase [Bacillota bacterium]NLL26309.1 Cof-type HAD-IIB family hydrolase [Erysipelotrichia bacterium]
MAIKIIFFDVDGTLKSFNNPGITEPVLHALQKLKEKGIKIFIATGRAPYAVPHFEGISFNGYLCYNGAYCYDEDSVLYSKPLDKKDLYQFIENAKKQNEPVIAAGKDEMCANGYGEKLNEYLSFAPLKYPSNDLNYFNEFIEGDIYQMMASGKPEKDEEFLKDCKHLKIARWWDHAFDLTSDSCSKSIAIQKVLEAYGFQREEAMAFGDGGNDLDMIEYVGLGVAMENASEEVKKAADYITDSVEDDGVVSALKNFNII